ncbi:MAG: GAF domain-containing protein, partial [Gammaproteobacteria bacterium]|nr:GAF domain-containing protein [Gammaproteobacteria bacterium]
MQKPIIPENESERVKSLIELNILDTPVTQSFERLTRITKVLFNVPMVTITLIDSERQWFKSKQGLDYCETSRDLSICAHAINQDDIFIINDTLLDSRFFDHPAVVGEPNIRFYAGYPILS